jgi:hypothetical protein
MRPTFVAPGLVVLSVLSMAGCGGGGDPAPAATTLSDTALVPAPSLTAFPDSLPVAGNSGACPVPSDAQLVDTSSPTTVVGTGTPASCTSAAVVQAVANGGVITFNCGAAPVTITLAATAKVFNKKPDVVLDGGGKVTLSGGGVRRILYQNTCDAAQGYSTASCNTQTSPTLTLQRITLADGNATGQTYGLGEVQGGGALFVRGGRVRIINSRFFSNTTELTGADLGGGAVRLFGTQQALVVGSTFGGDATHGNTSSNGGAISTLASSLSIYNTEISHNQAKGNGANPARAGTPGGGSGGAIYQDGNSFGLSVCGATVHDNRAVEGGSAIFFVSNNSTGTLSLTDSSFSAHPAGTFETPSLPGFFVKAATGQPVISNTTIVR